MSVADTNALHALASDGAAFSRKATAIRIIWTIATREVRDAVRNRWLIAFAICYALLSAAISLLTRAAAGGVGAAGFGRTAAGLINLVMILVPLMSMTAAASSIAGERERGMLSFVLAQPVSLVEVLLGKFLGLSMSVCAAVALGFGVGAALISGTGGADAAAFIEMTGLTGMLAVAMVSVGTLVSAWCRRTSTATTAVLLTWLTLVFGCDLILMGSHLAVQMGAPTVFHLALVNPLQAFKSAALQPLGGSLDVLGPAAGWAVYVYGWWLRPILIAALAVWCVWPFTAAVVIMKRRGIA